MNFQKKQSTPSRANTSSIKYVYFMVLLVGFGINKCFGGASILGMSSFKNG